MPAGHGGTIGAVSSSDPRPQSCNNDNQIYVDGTSIGDGVVTGTFSVASARLDVVVDSATEVLGHTAPTTVPVKILDGSKSVATADVAIGGSLTAYLAPGTYHASVAAGADFSTTFWPTDDGGGTGITLASGDTVTAHRALTEGTATVTVTVTTAGGANGEATITVSPGTSQGATYTATPTTTGDPHIVTLELPSGPWTISATFDGGTPVTSDINVNSATEDVSLAP
jgi:hypothetical protein